MYEDRVEAFRQIITRFNRNKNQCISCWSQVFAI